MVELIVVAGIVVVLSAIVVLSVASSRQKGRNGQRIADMNRAKIAVEQYYNGYRMYPRSDVQGYCQLVTPLQPYLPEFPRDPQDAGASCSALSKYEYYTNSALTPTQYLLRIPNLENPSTIQNLLKDDLDGSIAPLGGGGWVGGVAAASCTYTPPSTWSCPTINCGNASSDSVYCISGQ